MAESLQMQRCQFGENQNSRASALLVKFAAVVADWPRRRRRRDAFPPPFLPHSRRCGWVRHFPSIDDRQKQKSDEAEGKLYLTYPNLT